MEKFPTCDWNRRFGVEFEVNTEDKIIKRPNAELGEIPKGADYVALIVQEATGEHVMISPYRNVANNEMWIVKPDNSCGIEINSPVLKGWSGIKSSMIVADTLRSKYPHADDLCSLHVHVDISDLTLSQLGKVILYYIKSEHVFAHSFPTSRKINRYCRMVGMSNLFDAREPININDLIQRVSQDKYYSINTYSFVKSGALFDSAGKRTIEFRFAEGAACLDPIFVKNWIRLILHFVECVKDLPLPPRYSETRPGSGLSWLEPYQVFKMLKFDERLSPGLMQMRNWFLNRIRTNIDADFKQVDGYYGIFSQPFIIATDMKRLINNNYGDVPSEDLSNCMNDEYIF